MANNGMNNNIESIDTQPCLCNAISKCINFVIGKVGVIDGELWRYFSELYLKDLKNVKILNQNFGQNFDESNSSKKQSNLSMHDTMGDDSDENKNMDVTQGYMAQDKASLGAVLGAENLDHNLDQKTQYHFFMEKIVENDGICDPVFVHHFSIKMLSFVVKTNLVKHVMKKIIQPCQHQLELD
jgi:hypothetical protein